MADHYHPSSAADEVADTASTTSAASCGEDNRIKVVCRVRPPVSRETHGAKTLSLANRCVVVADDRRTVTISTKPQEKHFTFDYAAGEDSTQEELFAEVGKPVTEACLEGYNGTIFCYGQTGSGKTFTTFGPGAVMENHLNPSDPKSYALRGLVPRVLEYLYASIARQVENGRGKVSYKCKCSFYEIFNEKVFDLVDESNRDNPMGLTVREDTRKGVYVEGLMEEDVDGVDSACEVLHRGFRNRHVGETAMNRESSRSHAVFTLVIQATEVVEEEGLTRSRVARFNLVDLAGSERQKDTQASGERLKEASNINKSLSTLGQVINALVEKAPGRFRHVHYRDSKLTFLLRDSLGGNSKTMLVAALSPADQNFAETLSTLKFAQRAKMIKNQAVKNEDTSGSYDALKREVSALRHRLAAAQHGSGGDGRAGAGAGFPLAVVAAGEQTHLGGVSAANSGGSIDAAASEALLANALRRARAAEETQAGAKRRVESLLAAVEKGEKDALQLKMVIKFRDGTIAALRKKDADLERAAMADENAHLLKQLEGGVNESAEVSKWRLQCKEAEARLAELTGDASGDTKRLVWGVADEERFRGDLDDKMLSLMEENRQLMEASSAFEERLNHETRRAEKRRMSAANRAELEAKKIVENALLSKLQEAQGQMEETKAALEAAEERAASLESDKDRQDAAVQALTKQLQDANRRETEAVQDRDVRLADLQSKLEELSQAKERAVKDGGSELASLEVKMVGYIKDNSELLRANKALEEEADALDRDLEQLEAEKKALEEKAASERAEATGAIEILERRMQQQEDAHERECEEQQAEMRSVTKDLEAVTERLRSAEEAHGKEIDEHQRRSNDLQERLVETRELKDQLEARLKQLQDDYDTLSDQARFSQGQNQELETALERAAEDLRRAVAAGTARACVAQRQLLQAEASLSAAEDELAEARWKAGGEEFFKLAQGAAAARAEQSCADRDRRIECLIEELDAARDYAAGLRGLLLVREGDEVVGMRDWAMGGEVEAETKSREVVVGCAVMCREMMEEYEGAVERVENLEQMVDELVGDEDRLVEEVCGLQHRIEELEASVEVMTASLANKSDELDAARTTLERLGAEFAAASRALEEQEAATSELREELSSARAVAARAAAEADARAEELGAKLAGVRDSCFEYQARAVTAEGEVKALAADVAQLEEEGRAASTREAAMAELMKTREDIALAKERATRAIEEALQSSQENFDAKSEELAATKDQLEEARAEAAAGEARLEEMERNLHEETERTQGAEEEAAVLRGTIAGLEREIEALENGVHSGKEELAKAREEAAEVGQELAATKEELAVEKKELAAERGELAATKKKLAAAGEDLAAQKKELAAAGEDLADAHEDLATHKKELGARGKELGELKEELDTAEENLTGAEDKLRTLKNELAAQKKELRAQKAELGAAEKKLAEADKRVEALREALKVAEARAKEATDREGELRDASEAAEANSRRTAEAAGEKLKELQEQLSNETGKAEASESRAKQADVLKAKAEQLVANLKEEVAQLREEYQVAVDRLEESEAVQKVNAGKVIDLKTEVERLQGSMMSEEERESLESDLETVRQDLAETGRMLEEATSRNASLEEEIREMRGETEGYTAKVMELKDVNAALVGHKNTRQKIQQVQRLKEENNLLLRKVKELDDRLFNIKRSGCGAPGCGKNAEAPSAVAAAVPRDGETSLTSASSSYAGSQQSVSPTFRSRNGGGGGGGGLEGVGSAGKTYNLRRRPKAVEAASSGGGVNTRGRRIGLRDMTNANS